MNTLTNQELTLDDAQPTSPEFGHSFQEPLSLEPQGVPMDSGMSVMPNTTGWMPMPTDNVNVQVDRWDQMPTETQFMGNAGAAVDQGWSAHTSPAEMNYDASAQMNFGSPAQMNF